jgi:hypothetical protein
MDGKAYCAPKLGSTVFDEYWEECDSDNEVDYWEREYWLAYQALYTYEVSKPDCTDDLVEWSVLDALEDAAGFGGLLVLLSFWLTT